MSPFLVQLLEGRPLLLDEPILEILRGLAVNHTDPHLLTRHLRTCADDATFVIRIREQAAADVPVVAPERDDPLDFLDSVVV